MPIAAYPSTLPLLLRAQKARSQVASFSINEPRRGPGYVQETGTDTPVFWTGQFRFTRAEAIAFQIWFTQTIRRGALKFTMPIRTEFGLIDHECQFLPDGLADPTEDGDVWTYSVQLMARTQIIPQEYLDGGELIVGLPNWEQWAAALDQAVTQELPEAP
ncbi:hypothetical protein WAE61_02060 [Comamonadaceae bacterium PP-2]